MNFRAFSRDSSDCNSWRLAARGIKNRLACVGVGTVPPAGTEVASTEGNLRDPQPGLSKHSVLHVLFLSFLQYNIGGLVTQGLPPWG